MLPAATWSSGEKKLMPKSKKKKNILFFLQYHANVADVIWLKWEQNLKRSLESSVCVFVCVRGANEGTCWQPTDTLTDFSHTKYSNFVIMVYYAPFALLSTHSISHRYTHEYEDIYSYTCVAIYTCAKQEEDELEETKCGACSFARCILHTFK